MCAVLGVILSLPAAAEVQVNVRTSGAQAHAAVAVNPRGGAVVVWSSYSSASGRSNDILARWLSGAGSPVDDEFQVNAVFQGNQTEPDVAMDADGRMVLVWQGPGPDQEDIFLRLYDTGGNPFKSDLLVNLHTAGRQIYPRAATGSAGVFVVVWESREPTSEGERTLVYAQLFDWTGAGLGTEIRVDPDVYNCRYPDVAMDDGGNFAVAWTRDRSNHPIMVRLFDLSGIPRTDPLEVSTADVSSVTGPSIAMNSAGRFVVAWDGDPNRAGDDDIHARLYDADGAPSGQPFIANASRAGAQQWPQVAMGDTGEFVVIWEHNTGDSDMATDIYARRFAPDGQPRGSETRLNTHTRARQRYADIAMNSDGSFVATWESDGQDGSGYGIFAYLNPPTPQDGPAGSPQ
jgi:hypothetical protein